MRLRILSEFESESVTIAIGLKIESARVKEAMGIVRNSYPAQITLACALRCKRFSHAFQTMLIPTECPNEKRTGDFCGEGDSLEHLIDCYGLKKYENSNPCVVHFLVKMAISAIPPVPGFSAPRYIV